MTKSSHRSYVAGLRAALTIAESQRYAPSWWVRDKIRERLRHEEEKKETNMKDRTQKGAR